MHAMSRSIRRLYLTTLTVVLVSLPHLAVAGQAVKMIETRPGVAMRLAVIAPETPAKGSLIMFPGGNGAGHFREHDGVIHLSSNFLMRTAPQFVQRGFAVAIIDTPSDQRGGMSDAFRTSPQHAADVESALASLAEQGLQPIYLVGTSRGTLSVAYLATVLRDDRVKGVVLTSSLGGPHGLVALPLGRITVPVLIVHHRDDACRASSFQDATHLTRLITGSPRLSFVEARGGRPSPADPCEPLSAHGYLGVESQVVQAITDWISGNIVPPVIGP